MTTQEIIEGNKLIAEFRELGYDVFKNGMVRGVSGRLLRIHKNKNGYIQVNTWNNNKQKTFLVHRLVASAFIPNQDNLPEVNHIDGNKQNNNVTNLEWCTRSENIKHGINNGLIPSPWKNKKGKDHIRSKNVYQIYGGKVINEFGSAREAARESGICYGTISNVLIGRGKTAGGYYWSYTNNQNKN